VVTRDDEARASSMNRTAVTRRENPWRDAGPLILRVGVGAIFIGAGLQKLMKIGGGTGIAGAAALFRAIHLEPALPLAVFIAWFEVIGGTLLILGALTQPISILFMVEMVVAIWKVHFVNGFFLNWTMKPGVGHGYEFNFILICASTSLLFTGPGAFAIDGVARRRGAAS